MKLDRRFLDKGLIKALVGFALGVGATIFWYERKTLLEITDEDIRTLKAATQTGVFETKYGPLYVGVSDFSEGY